MSQPVKIFISIDYEGLLGACSWENEKKEGFLRELELIYDALREKYYWEQIEKITVCDAHGKGENINYFDLQKIDSEKTCLISGPVRNSFMMEGIEGHNMMFFIGYHAKFGEELSIMDHSYGLNSFYKVRIRGEEVSEAVINAYFAGEYGVPLALISGDSGLKKEIKTLASDLCFIETKEGRGRLNACFHPISRIKREYERGLKKIFDDGYRGKLFKIKEGVDLQIDFKSTDSAELCALIPGTEKISGYTVQYYSANYLNIFKFIQSAALISSYER